jgi:hypothetical protein
MATPGTALPEIAGRVQQISLQQLCPRRRQRGDRNVERRSLGVSPGFFE